MDVSMRSESDSDDSDDIIPPTPVFKSTPLVPSNQSRKHLSASKNSSNLLKNQTSFISNRATEAVSSSSDDEGSHQLTTLNRNNPITLKREKVSPDHNDSTRGDAGNHRGNSFGSNHTGRFSLARNGRPVNSMSSSSSEDSDQEAPAAKTQMRKDSESDEDSSDNDANYFSRSMPTTMKVEKPSETDSEDSNDDRTSEVRNGHSNFNQPKSKDSSSSESEEENEKATITRPPTDSSSEESDDEDVNLKLQVLRSNNERDSTSDDESKTVQIPVKKPELSNDTSSSDSESETLQKPSVNEPLHSNETSSSDNESELQHKITIQEGAKPSQSNETSSSDDESEPAQKVLFNDGNKPAQSSSSSEDESEQVTKSAAFLRNRNTVKPNEDSSDDEERSLKPPSSSIYQNTYYDSSDESENDAIAKQQKDNGLDSIIKSNTSIQAIVGNRPPSSKKGESLLDETLQENRPLQVKDAVLSLEDIGNDDEIWLLQCPKSMNIATLKKQRLNLAADHDIQLEDGPTFKRYSVTSEQSRNGAVNCLLPLKDTDKFQIAYLPVRGKVVMQEHVHVPKLRIPEVSVKGPVPFPSGLKVRHPLLGAEFKKHIEEAKVALQESSSSSKKKKKDKYKDKSGSRNLGESSAENMVSKYQDRSLLSSSTQSNGKKKRSKSQLDVSNISVNTSFEVGSAKKSKKAVSVASDHLPDQHGDLSSLNESYQKKHKKSKRSMDERSFDHNIEARSFDPKPSWHTPRVNNDLLSAGGEHSKKIKKSKKDLSQVSISDIRQELNDSMFVNGISNEENQNSSVSKKRKRKLESQEEDSFQLDRSVDSSIGVSKRKKARL